MKTLLILLLIPLTLYAEPKIGDAYEVERCKGRIIQIVKDFPEDPDNYYIVKFIKCKYTLKLNINDIEGYVPDATDD